MRSAIFCCMVATAAQADDAMNAPAFQDFTEGRIFTFARGEGPPFDTEYYLPDREVILITTDGDCHKGSWYEDDQFICFRYDSFGTVTCAEFFGHDDKMTVIPKDSSPIYFGWVNDQASTAQCEGGQS